MKNELIRLEEKIDNMANEIIFNMNKLHSHEKLISDNSKNIKKNSYALEILSDYKAAVENYKELSKKYFAFSIIFAICWIVTLAALIFVIFMLK